MRVIRMRRYFGDAMAPEIWRSVMGLLKTPAKRSNSECEGKGLYGVYCIQEGDLPIRTGHDNLPTKIERYTTAEWWVPAVSHQVVPMLCVPKRMVHPMTEFKGDDIEIECSPLVKG
jgi:hypothetical protein